jgi:hypothetical protein
MRCHFWVVLALRKCGDWVGGDEERECGEGKGHGCAGFAHNEMMMLSRAGTLFFPHGIRRIGSVEINLEIVSQYEKAGT